MKQTKIVTSSIGSQPTVMAYNNYQLLILQIKVFMGAVTEIIVAT
jgi:hypothetical protein